MREKKKGSIFRWEALTCWMGKVDGTGSWRLPLRGADLGRGSFSGPDLGHRDVLVRHVPGQEVARRADHLDGVDPDLGGPVHGGSPGGVAGDVEMVGAAAAIPEGVPPPDLGDVPLDEAGDAADADFWVVPQRRDREGEEEKVSLRGVVRDEVAPHERLEEVALAGVVPRRLKVNGQEGVGEGLVVLVRVDEDLQAPVHLLVVFQELVPVEEDRAPFDPGAP